MFSREVSDLFKYGSQQTLPPGRKLQGLVPIEKASGEPQMG